MTTLQALIRRCRAVLRSRAALRRGAMILDVVLLGLLAGCSAEPTSDVSIPGVQSANANVELDGSSLPPWDLPADVPGHVAAAGLNLGPMGMAEHYHPELQVIINGDKVPIPANIGVDPATGAMSALHTHTPDGVVHIEADRPDEVFTLGQLFTQWGVQLSSTQIGGVHVKSDQTVTVTSNGERVAGDPADLRLAPDQQIVLQLP